MELCDLTLREASQRPGREYAVDQRVEVGHALDGLGVPLVGVSAPDTDSAEGGAIERLASELTADVVVSCRPTVAHVEAALEAGADTIEVSVPVSKGRLDAGLGCSRNEAFDRAADALLRAREGGVDVSLALVDAFRAEVPAVAGAFGRFDCPIVLVDSVGARTPPFVAGFLRTLADASADLSGAGVRFRDDLGCATANALVATQVGVGRVDAAVAGLGRRAGLAATEEVIVATEAGESAADVDTERVVPACQDVLVALEESVDERKAVLGEAATRRAVDEAYALEAPEAFEPFDPERFGGRRKLTFGAKTERDAVETLLERADTTVTEERTRALLERLAEEGPVDLETALGLAAEE